MPKYENESQQPGPHISEIEQTVKARNVSRPCQKGLVNAFGKTKVKSLIYILLTVLLTVILLEIIVRTGLYFFPRPKILIWHEQGIMTAANEAASYVRFRPNRQSSDINSFGFHSPEIQFEKPINQRRIAFLGGSTTFNAGPVVETYPDLLVAHLRQNGLETDYINAGANGYMSTESLILYHLRVKAMDPDLVIFYNGRNELLVSGTGAYSSNDLTLMGRPPNYSFPPKLHQSLSRISNLYAISMEFMGLYSYRKNNWDRRLRHRRKSAKDRSVDVFIENVKKEEGFCLYVYKNNVEALAVLTGHNRTKLLLVGFDIYPKRLYSVNVPRDRKLTPIESEFIGEMVIKMNQILKEIADKFPHVLYLDLHNKINREYFIDDCHLMLDGKRQKAEIIGRFIINHREELGWSGI